MVPEPVTGKQHSEEVTAERELPLCYRLSVVFSHAMIIVISHIAA
jgi:hypothetical protein